MAETVSRLVLRKATVETTRYLRCSQRDLEAFATRLFAVIAGNIENPAVLQRIADGFRASLAADHVRGPLVTIPVKTIDASNKCN